MTKSDPTSPSSTTMGDIARMAGVSESTVSRALSGSPLVAASTRARVLEIARSADFAVNEQARSLAKGRTQTIEVIFPIERGTLQQVSDPFFVDMLGVLADALGREGYDVLMSRSPPWDPERPGCAFLGARADGVVFVGQGRHRSEIRDFARRHGRVVAWGAVLPGDDYCVVGSDNEGGGHLATRHMLELGRRRIAFLGDITLPEIAQRHEGYCRALREAGVSVYEQLVVSTPFDIEAARELTRPFIQDGPEFDGVFASSDMIAIAALANLRAQGIRVPEDVSVVGFDDIPSSKHVSPALTTVHQRIRLGGKTLVHSLLELLAGREQKPVVLETDLRVRQSCGGKS